MMTGNDRSCYDVNEGLVTSFARNRSIAMLGIDRFCKDVNEGLVTFA